MNRPSDQERNAPAGQPAPRTDDGTNAYTDLLIPLLAAIAQRIVADYSASDDGSAPSPWMGALIAFGAALVAASSLTGL